MVDFTHAWLPYIYQYGLGGLIFVIGIFLTLKAGSFHPSHPRHGKWMIILLLGFVWYLVLHGGMIVAALGHERTALTLGSLIVAASTVLSVVWYRRQRGGA